MKLVIDRAKWGRGHDDVCTKVGQGVLLDKDSGKMCCLGFLALECGASPVDIENLGMPADVAALRPASGVEWPDWVLETRPRPLAPIRDTPVTEGLAKRNDSPDDEGREHDIARMFSEVGVEVEFVG